MRAIADTDAAVTGVGVVTALGVGTAATWEGLLLGRDGARTVPEDGGPHDIGRAATIDEPWLRTTVPEAQEAQAKFLNPSGQLAVTAAAEAATAGGLAGAATTEGDRAFFLAQCDWTPCSFQHFHAPFEEASDGFKKPAEGEALNAATIRKLNPFYLLETLHNNAFSLLSAVHGLRGPNTSTSGWSGTGLAALSLCARTIARGGARVGLVVGAGRLTTPTARLEIGRLHPLGAEVVPGEGAGALCLEPLAAARARGLAPLAVVLGHGAAHGAPVERRPLARTLATAAREALREAGAFAGELSAVLAFDAEDARAALATIPGGSGVPVLAWRRQTGEMGPGSDVAEAALAAHALAVGRLPGLPAAPTSILLLACGVDGQAFAVLLARA